jgi:hypothetical protein
MSDIERIENVLRRAPRVKAPAGLADKLKADISMPHASATAGATDFWVGFPPLVSNLCDGRTVPYLPGRPRRPATCVVGICDKNKNNSNPPRRGSAGGRLKRAAQEQAQAQAAQLAQLRKDNSELQQQLRAEDLHSWREQVQQLPALRAEQQRPCSYKRRQWKRNRAVTTPSRWHRTNRNGSFA